MSDLLDRCMAHTGREYPGGYGFALAYLPHASKNLSELKETANRVAARALLGHGVLSQKHDDLVRFVQAQATSKRFEDWLIEGAQLVLSAALGGWHEAQSTMARCGHPGYKVHKRDMVD